MAHRSRDFLEVAQWAKTLVLVAGAILFTAAAAVLVMMISVRIALPLSSLDSDLAAWVQAVGTTTAIVAGFAVAIFQVRAQARHAEREQRALGRAAQLLAGEALRLITDRLETALFPRTGSRLFQLRGSRTTELIQAVREFDAARLPTELIVPFVELRSCLYAINTQISDLYQREEACPKGPQQKRLKANRRSELRSAARVYRRGREAYQLLDEATVRTCDGERREIPLPRLLQDYLTQEAPGPGAVASATSVD